MIFWRRHFPSQEREERGSSGGGEGGGSTKIYPRPAAVGGRGRPRHCRGHSFPCFKTFLPPPVASLTTERASLRFLFAYRRSGGRESEGACERASPVPVHLPCFPPRPSVRHFQSRSVPSPDFLQTLPSLPSSSAPPSILSFACSALSNRNSKVETASCTPDK